MCYMHICLSDTRESVYDTVKIFIDSDNTLLAVLTPLVTRFSHLLINGKVQKQREQSAKQSKEGTLY